MISSQRLIIILLVTNILIGLGMNMNYNLQISKMSNDLNGYYNMSDFYGNNTEWGSVKTTDVRGFESSIGNPISMGSLIWTIFIDALFPIPKDFNNVSYNYVESLFMYGISLFRVLLYLITVVEIIFIFKNKKTT